MKHLALSAFLGLSLSSLASSNDVTLGELNHLIGKWEVIRDDTDAPVNDHKYQVDFNKPYCSTQGYAQTGIYRVILKIEEKTTEFVQEGTITVVIEEFFGEGRSMPWYRAFDRASFHHINLGPVVKGTPVGKITHNTYFDKATFTLVHQLQFDREGTEQRLWVDDKDSLVYEYQYDPKRVSIRCRFRRVAE